MAEFMGRTDIMMTLDGDLVVGGDGDFKLTDGFDWLSREINKRVRTINPEWRIHPTIGANVESFVGKLNNRFNLAELRRQILDSITKYNLQDPGQIDVRVVPTGLDKVGIFIFLDVAGHRRTLSQVVFDFNNGTIQEIADPVADASKTIIDESEKLSSKTHRMTENKYLKRNFGARSQT